MFKRFLGPAVAFAAAALVFTIQPLQAHGGSNSFDDHWLAAACPAASTRAAHEVVQTDFGVAVQHRERARGRIVLHCNIEADDYHNWLQFSAEDNSPGAWVTVNLYRQDIVSGGSPELLQSLTSVDTPGVQQAEVFIDPALEFDEFSFLYYLEIIIERESPFDTVRIYHISLRDVL